MRDDIQEICRLGLRYSQSAICHEHVHGTCVISPDHAYQFVKIPKNASIWTQGVLSRHLFWGLGNFHGTQTKTTLICLRDPVDRWVSGIVEYVDRHRNGFRLATADPMILKCIVDGMVFDSHTVPQTVFLDGLVAHDVVWLMADTSYQNNLTSYLKSQALLPASLQQVDEAVNEFRNDHLDQPNKIANYNFLQELCAGNTSTRSRIEDFYRYDYELIKTVAFYSDSKL